MVAIPLMRITSEHSYARKPRFATGILGTVVATMMTLLLLTSTSIHMNPRSMAYKAAGRVSNGWEAHSCHLLKPLQWEQTNPGRMYHISHTGTPRTDSSTTK